MKISKTITVLVATWIVVAGVAIGEPVIVDLNTFPVTGTAYNSENGTTYPEATIPIELVALTLVSIDPINVVDPNGIGQGQVFTVDSFFDVFTEIALNGGSIVSIDSFFDSNVTLSIQRDGTGSWDTEIVAMSLSGSVGGIPIEIRESPSLPSPGHHSVAELINVAESHGTGQGQLFTVDSFFDVFTEISVDGGPFVPATNSMRMSISLNPDLPEPATMSLLCLSGMGMLCKRRRKNITE